MIQYNGICIFDSAFLPRDRFLKSNEGIIMNPYSIGLLMLNEFKNTYYDVFKKLGINNDTLDACGTYALKRIKEQISNFNYL
jgi:hypothetical protein